MSVLIEHDPLQSEGNGGPDSSSGETGPAPRLPVYGLLIGAGIVTLLWLLFLGWETYRFLAWVAGE